MKEYDCVEVIVEKEKYAREGVHKGMQGTILDPRNIDGQWLVFFADPVTLADTIGIPIKEKDLKVIVEFKKDTPQKNSKIILNEDSVEYAKNNVFLGMNGTIISEHAENGKWLVSFLDENGKELQCLIREEDLFVYEK